MNLIFLPTVKLHQHLLLLQRRLHPHPHHHHQHLLHLQSLGGVSTFPPITFASRHGVYNAFCLL